MHGQIFPRSGETALVVIDVQEGLLPAVGEAAGPRLIKAHQVLLELAEMEGMPVFYTEHYPKGLGSTVPVLKERLQDRPRIVKTEFSACGNLDFREQVVKNLTEDVILTGIETHVCVLLTALDLIHFGFRVFVPLDAVASRDQEHRQNGLDLLTRAGAVVINTESLVFQRLGKAGTDSFKRMLKVLK